MSLSIHEIIQLAFQDALESLQVEPYHETQSVMVPLTTTNEYQEITTWQKANLKTSTIFIRNEGNNPADVRILGSLDDGGTYPIVVSAEQTITGGNSVQIILNDYYTDVKIEGKANTGGNQTTLSAQMAGIAA